jgi:hypothetical protein
MEKKHDMAQRHGDIDWRRGSTREGKRRFMDMYGHLLGVLL